MEKEKNFVQKIIVDATKQQEGIKQKAELEAFNIVAEKEKEEKEFFNAEKNALKQEFENLLNNEKDISFLQQNQQILLAKQNMIVDVFDLVLQKLKKLTAKEELSFVENVLKKFSNPGDEIIISNKKGEQERVEKLSVFKQKKLKICDISKDISGGVIIVSQKYEQDFSFEGLVNDEFLSAKYQIAKQLF